MKRPALIALSLVVLITGFLLESLPGFAQSAPRTRNNLDSGLMYQQEGAGKQFQPQVPAARQTQPKNNVRRNRITKGDAKNQ